VLVENLFSHVVRKGLEESDVDAGVGDVDFLPVD
jgi:hypothetical protein